MNAHESKCFIQLVQILQFFNRILRFDLLSHGNPINTFFAQHYLHINPPINVVGRVIGVKTAKFSILQLQREAQFLGTLKFTCKNTSIQSQTNSITLHFDMCTFSGCITPSQTCLDKIWNPDSYGASMEVSKD